MAAMKITAAMAQMKRARIVLLLPPMSPLEMIVFLSDTLIACLIGSHAQGFIYIYLVDRSNASQTSPLIGPNQ